ncbi:MAG: hydantoinase B/oxoprolinase family protein, partial [Pseudorhodoplanes sp.]
LSAPVVTEIVRNGLVAAAEEKKTTQMRTAYNRIIYEGLDFTVGLFTANGDAMSIGIGLPMFVRGLSDTVKRMLNHYRKDGIDPGDVLVTNDCRVTGSHLNHVTLVLPIFAESRLVAFAAAMGHWIDIGGVLDGVTKDIYSEGLQIPILKAERKGVVNQDLLEIIHLNVRHPERAIGDWRAEMTAVRTGERRFLELVNRYGRDAVLGAVDRIMKQSEEAARAATLTIPDGVYTAESFMDSDGVTFDKRVRIAVKVIVEGDQMTIDLSGVSPAVDGFYNSGASTGIGCAELAFKCLTSAEDFPINQGSFRPLKVILPEGTVVSAAHPAPMRWWMTYPMTIVDTVFKALSKAIPQRVIAGHHADLNVVMMNWLQDGVRQVSHVSTSGGWGAKHNQDGMCNTVCINDGDTHRAPIEQIECKNPLLIERWELAADSGGAGRQRGGLGTVQVVQLLRDQAVNVQIERHIDPPWGLDGGLPGSANSVSLRRNGRVEEAGADDQPKLLGVQLLAGDALILQSGGGGGFGSPLERPLDAVAEDLRNGYITAAEAQENYGVALDDSGQVDKGATESLRRRRARAFMAATA